MKARKKEATVERNYRRHLKRIASEKKKKEGVQFLFFFIYFFFFICFRTEDIEKENNLKRESLQYKKIDFWKGKFFFFLIH
jgi:hypothetical protein